MVSVLVLGELALEADGRVLNRIGSHRARSLLGWLAVHPGLHPRARVAAVFWPDVLDASARTSLRSTLAVLRRELGEPGASLVTATRDRLGIQPGAEVWIDLHAFEQLVSRGRLEQAADLCHGELLRDLDDDWVNEPRERHRHQLLGVLGRLAEEAERSGDLETALKRTREQVALDPLSEEAQRDLVRRLAATGDRAGGLAAYQSYGERLRRQLGIAPSAATRELAESVRSGEAGRGPELAKPEPPASLPAILARPEPVPMVGREAELKHLRSALHRATEGQLHAVLVTGEAGSGKSRLVAEFAREAHTAGTSVWAGRCHEGSPVPYGPFVEALRPHAGMDRLPAWAAEELSRLLPELTGLDPAPPASASDPEGARYRLFEAVVSAVVEASSDAPVLLVLEDLHWADHSTLLMLAHLTRVTSTSRILVLGTAREGEPVPDGLAKLLAELTRDRRLTRLALGGLTETEVGALASAWLEEEPAAGLAAELHGRTGGNPLFVQELLRQTQEADGLGEASLPPGVPAGVQEVISQRVGRLGEPSAEALAIAAALGDDFDIHEVAETAGRETNDLVGPLDAALAAGLLREVPGSAGRYRFSHDLVRETVYGAQSATSRALLHLRIADALERLRSDDRDRLPELARHMADAGPAGDVERTVRYALLAGEVALARLAYEEAAAICQRALRVADQARFEGSGRIDLLLACGEACLRAGDAEGARARFTGAAEAAREAQEPDLLARAALGFAGLGVTITAPRPEVRGLLEEALAAVSAGSALRPPLLARLAIELYYAPPSARRAALSEEAVRAARPLGGGALLDALNARHVALWGPDHLEERLELADELLSGARVAGDRERELQGLNWRVLDLIEAGRLDAAREAIDAHEALADDLLLHAYRWYAPMWRAMLAALAGRFEEAEEFTAAGELIGRRAQDANAVLLFEIQRFYLRYLEGTSPDEDIVAIEQRASASPAGYAWYAFLAEIQVAMGREKEARRWLRIGAQNLDGLPRDVNWLYTVTGLGRTSASIGEIALAESIYGQMAPYSDRNVMAGRATVCIGSAALALGQMADALGRPDEAEGHFEQALRRNSELGARPWLERTQLAFAAMLKRRGDTTRAGAVLAGSHAGITRTSR
jgi:DNA-binding SARP family transcriptional activator